MKKIAVLILIGCFIISGLAIADDKKTPIPNTIVSPELLGPHYLWSADIPDTPEEENDETNIAELVREKTISPGVEERIKEVTDQSKTN